jgi:hypothetical protein
MIEIEVAQPNTNFHFRPLQRTVRGRFEMAAVPEPMAKIEASNWPLPIPGQRLGIDREGIGYIIEPLHEAGNAPIREKIEKRGAKLEPAQTLYEAIDLPTWHYWLKRAVDSGLCRIVAGKLPDAIEGTPRKNFILADPGPTAGDKLTAAIEAQTAAFAGLTAAIGELLKARK